MPKKIPQKKTKVDARECLIFLAENALVVIVLFLFTFNLNLYLSNHVRVLGASSEIIIDNHAKLTQEKDFWINVVESNPSYKDAYIELADIFTRLGDNNKATEYLIRGNMIKPN